MLVYRPLTSLLLALTLFAPAAAQDAQTRSLAVGDIFTIQRVGSPRISPDAEWVAYTISTTMEKEDKSETRIWMVPARGGEAIPLTVAGSSASSPAWRPDGRVLAFTSSREGNTSQVWTLDRRGGEAQKLTDVKQGVSSFEWSPDGKRLALVIRDADPAASDSSAMKSPRPWVIDRIQFKTDGSGYLSRRRSHIYVFDIATKALRQVTSGDYDHSSPAWSPDGRQLAFVSNRDEEPDLTANSDVWVVAADDADADPRRMTGGPGGDNSPAWSPDGRFIVYVSNPATEPAGLAYGNTELGIVSVVDGARRPLARTLDRSVSSPRFTADGNAVLFLVTDEGERALARVDVASGQVTRVGGGQQTFGSFDLHPAGTIAALVSEPHLPGEIFAGAAGALQRLTTTNDSLLRGLRLGAVEKTQFRSKDGTQIDAFVVKPPDYRAGTRYPTLLWLHGGPVSQHDWSFDFTAQLFAAHGYAVVLTNYRGSSGYGRAFTEALFRRWDGKPLEDALAAADHAVALGIADPDRLGVGGWSFGGIMTNLVITNTTRFKAAMSGASEVLYMSNYGHDQYQRLWETEYGLPWRTPEAWQRASPFFKMEMITTPTLIMGGEKDWNVPIINSEQLYLGMRRLGRTAELVVYPDENHGIRRPAFQKDRYERWLAWFDRFLARSAADAGGR